MHSLKVLVGRQDADILVFGPEDAANYGLSSWSLKPLKKHADFNVNWKLTRILSEELSGLGIHEAFIPRVALASARIINTTDLNQMIRLRQARLYWNPDLLADGILIEPNQAFIMSAAGCPVIIATAGEDMIVAHAARDSLLDRGAINGKSTREHFSVVNAIIDKFKKRGASVQDIVMTMLFTIPTREFEHSIAHPQYGDYNRKLIAFIDSRYPYSILRTGGTTYLALEEVFVAQASLAGVRMVYATHSLDIFPDLVHTAATDQRNLIIIKRTS